MVNEKKTKKFRKSSAQDDVLANDLASHSVGCRRLERECMLMLLLVPLSALGAEWIPSQSASGRGSGLAASAAVDRPVSILVRV